VDVYVVGLIMPPVVIKLISRASVKPREYNCVAIVVSKVISRAFRELSMRYGEKELSEISVRDCCVISVVAMEIFAEISVNIELIEKFL
jgi:hypothetical protein